MLNVSLCIQFSNQARSVGCTVMSARRSEITADVQTSLRLASDFTLTCAPRALDSRHGALSANRLSVGQREQSCGWRSDRIHASVSYTVSHLISMLAQYTRIGAVTTAIAATAAAATATDVGMALDAEGGRLGLVKWCSSTSRNMPHLIRTVYYALKDIA